MSIHWRKLLEFARDVSSSMESEVARRTAASRAYYAAYHCSCDHLGIKDYIGHRMVVEQLLASSSRRDVAAGRMLNQAMRRRVRADYHLDDSFIERDMQACIDDAAKVVGMLGAGKHGE